MRPPLARHNMESVLETKPLVEWDEMVETPHIPEPLSRPHPGMQITGDPSRVLIVDDDESLRETIADLLELAGFHPIKAPNAAEALMILQQEHRVDALITDLAMPGVDGVDLIRQAHEIRPELPALLLTGYAELTSAAATVGSSNFHILRKPVESQRLIKQLEAIIGSPATHSAPVKPCGDLAGGLA